MEIARYIVYETKGRVTQKYSSRIVKYLKEKIIGKKGKNPKQLKHNQI